VDQLESGHVVLLNKYPVQSCHLLLISGEWQPQQGWLEGQDWQAVAKVAADTGGLWFFNSSALAGASQPHRHLQLLPRQGDEPSCPLAESINQQLRQEHPPWPWAYRISPRLDPLGCSDLAEIYAGHSRDLGLGEPGLQDQPLHPYNLIFDDSWFLTVRRLREHCAGFSVNGLGFAGYLLVRVVPTVTEFYTIKGVVDRIAASPANTVAEIRGAFDKQRQIDPTITSLAAKELDITKQNDRVVISFAYEKEIELLGPVFLLIKYAGRSK